VHTFSHFPYRKATVLENMAADAVLLEMCLSQACMGLRFYGWLSPAMTFGYGQRFNALPPSDPFDLPRLRRLSGGGVVYHGSDLTYALALPADCSWARMPAGDTYLLLHTNLISALRDNGCDARLAGCPKNCPASDGDPAICFVYPQLHDVLSNDGRKIAGAAMRRSGRGMLIQGSVHLPDSVTADNFQEAFQLRLNAALSASNITAASLPSDRTAAWTRKFADPAWNHRR
jgi:lipoate-protein ligase A